MKVLVLSDSHGNLTNMVRAVEAESPHMIVHLGDGWREARQLHGQFPMLPFYQVPGNCDFRPSEPAEQLLFWEEKRVLICHGHTYGVLSLIDILVDGRYVDVLRAGYAAEEENLDLFLFGHTHQPLVDMRGKTLFLNPGSIGDHFRPFYGIITLQNSHLDGHTVPLV